MKFLLLSFVFFLSTIGTAQSISGSLQDEKGEALPYATIQLLKKDSTVHKIEMSNGNGQFIFNNLKAEKYFLSVSFLGFKTYSKSIDLANSNGNLGIVKMQAQSQALEEVTISAERPMIEIEPDKTVFNVSKNLSATGDDGIELLRKAPGLQVDNNDNIILEGKSGINVYVNGKQSYLQGQDLTNYLKSIKAEEIEKIEIITQPSSKYDAAGSAGIINIVLKREKGLGTKGSITNTYTQGDYGRNNTTLNVNHRSKQFALFSTYSHYQGKSSGFFDMYREQGPNVFDGKTRSTNENFNDRLSFGGDYYLSKNSTIGLGASASLNEGENISNSSTPMSQTDDFVVDSILKAPNENNSEVKNYTANINYNFEDTSGRSVSIDLDYVNFSSVREALQPNIYYSPDEQVILNQNINFQETPIDIGVYSAKIDYEQDLGKGVLAIGAKGSQVLTENVFDFYEVLNGQQNLDVNRSNTFNYEEVIAAGYLNYKFSWKKLKLQAGLRAEQTYSEGKLKSSTALSNKEVKRSYLNWFPSGGITYQVNENNSSSLIYSRRIQRPNYQNLNPFESQLNELSFRRGNPFLQPQFIDNIKLSNTYKYTLTTSFTFSYISDYFAEVTEAEGDRKSFINTRNVADQQVYNLSVSYPKKIKKWWNVYASVYSYYTKFTANNPDFIPIDRFVYGGYAQSTFSLPKKYKFEVSGWYSSPSIWRGTFRTESIGSLNLAVQKTWKQWSAKLSVNDVLYSVPWRAENRFGNLYLTGTGGSDSRNVRLYLSYTFGRSDVKATKKRKSGSEDEQNRIGG